MLKNLADDRSNCDASIVVKVTLIALLVFHNGNIAAVLLLVLFFVLLFVLFIVLLFVLYFSSWFVCKFFLFDLPSFWFVPFILLSHSFSFLFCCFRNLTARRVLSLV